MKVVLFVAFWFLGVVSFFAQTSNSNKKRIEIDSTNSCITMFDSNIIISKTIQTELFFYQAKYQFAAKSFVEAKLTLSQFFDTLASYLDSNLKQHLTIKFPYYQFRVENKNGYSYLFTTTYQDERHTIFRDCGCGTFKGMRIYGGRFSGYNNQLFNRDIPFVLRSRNRYGDHDTFFKFFDFKLKKGLPSLFVSYQDTNKMDKKVVFKNGLVDSIQAFYLNGSRMYRASLINGKLQGDFVYWDEFGNEKLKVNFNENKVNYFY